VNSKLEFSSSLSSENLIDDSVYDANDDLARFLNEPVDQENFSENNHDESLNSKPEINSKSTSSQLNQPASTEKENDHLSQDNLSNSSMNLNNSKYNYQISYKDSDGHVFNAQRVILAVPAYIASNLIGDLNLSLAKALKKINYAPMFLYTFSVAKSLFKADLEGFGYLVESDQPASLGAIFSSQVFKERNLESEYLLTAFVGGANFELASYFKQRELDKFSKADLEQKLWENTVVKEQAKFLSDFTRVPLRNNDLKLVNTWSAKHAIPQYNLNSEDARTKLKEHMELDPSLVFASNYLYGISVADTIKSTIELMIN
jgi:protoporphyrinogen oxidase